MLSLLLSKTAAAASFHVGIGALVSDAVGALGCVLGLCIVVALASITNAALARDDIVIGAVDAAGYWVELAGEAAATSFHAGIAVISLSLASVAVAVLATFILLVRKCLASTLEP
jgi:hypothetical protein